MFVAVGGVGLALAATSSRNTEARAVGYRLLGRYHELVSNATAFAERRQVDVLLTVLKNAITEPNQRIPPLVAEFCAQAAVLALHPYVTIASIALYVARQPRP